MTEKHWSIPALMKDCWEKEIEAYPACGGENITKVEATSEDIPF